MYTDKSEAVPHLRRSINPYPQEFFRRTLLQRYKGSGERRTKVEEKAIDEWNALTPPTVTGNPPIQQNTGTAAVETLGKLLNFDEHISVKQNIAAVSVTCRTPDIVDRFRRSICRWSRTPDPFTIVRASGRRRDTRTRLFSPYFSTTPSRAPSLAETSGIRVPPAIDSQRRCEQAQFPPVDPLEMGMPDTACIVYRMSKAKYRPLFEQVWGAGSLDINWPANTEQICSTPNGASQFGGSATPVHLSPEDRTRSNTAYNEWGLSIDAFEQSAAVSAFSSKFDAYLKGNYVMTTDEMAGYNLFRGKGTATPAIWTAGQPPRRPRRPTDLPQQRRHRYSREHGAAVHLLRFGQSRSAEECRRGLLL